MLWLWQVSPEAKKIAADLLDEDIWVFCQSDFSFIKRGSQPTLRLKVHHNSVLIGEAVVYRGPDRRAIVNAVYQRRTDFLFNQLAETLREAARDLA